MTKTSTPRIAWSPLRQPFDQAVLAGRVTPGLVDFDGLSSPREFEERGGFGVNGATIVFRAKKLCHFRMTFRLYTEEHWAEWNAFAPFALQLPLGKNARALDIVHPLTEQMGIRSIVLDDIVAPVASDDTGEWSAVLSCIEYRAPTFGASKPEGSEDKPPDPNADLQSKLDKGAERLAKLWDQLSGAL